MAGQTHPVGCRALTLAIASLTPATVLPYRGATIVTRDVLLQTYDYIVVGAGTAGLTMADRLSESGKYTVLAVEYGYLDTGISITTSGGPFRTLGPPNRTFEHEPYPAATRFYNLMSEPMPGLNNRQQNMQAGCIVGGVSAVNGMVFGRGSAEDYDAWVLAAGLEHKKEYAAEWGWDNLLPFFRKSTTFYEPPKEMVDEFGMTSDAPAAYRDDTPIHSSFAPFQWPALSESSPDWGHRMKGTNQESRGRMECFQAHCWGRFP
jgi:choline dehydrogenase-like flavoprotein